MKQQTTPYRDLALFDAFEQQRAQDWLPLDIIQLSAGTYRGHLREITHDDVSVCFETQNSMIHKRGVMADSFCTVSFSRTPNAKVRLCEHNAHENSLFFVPSGSEVDIQVEANADTVYFRINQETFLERARIISPQMWGKSSHSILSINSMLRQPLEAFSQYIYENPQSLSHNSIINNKLDLFIVDKLLLAMVSSTQNDVVDKDFNARYRAKEKVDKALDYIHGALNHGICPTIVDICVEINISQRNLQYSFKKILAITPNAYLYHLRLNRVRAQLKHPANTDVTVTKIASDWKFWHLGRFANDYLQLFGELPSTTLTNARKL